MTALDQLKAGPFRRGRGGNLEEVRQKEDESVQRDELLRAGMVELCASVEALESSDSGGGSAATVVHREPFGYENATASARFVPFANHPTESTTVAYQNVWRAPFAGSITRVSIITSSNAANTVLQWYEPDGSTTVGSSVTESPALFTIETGSGYLATYAFDDVTVTSGGLYALEIDPTNSIGDVTGWLELTAS